MFVSLSLSKLSSEKHTHSTQQVELRHHSGKNRVVVTKHTKTNQFIIKLNPDEHKHKSDKRKAFRSSKYDNNRCCSSFILLYYFKSSAQIHTYIYKVVN